MDRNNPFHPKAVGERLAALRTYHDMLPSHFADSVNIDRTSYGRIERGEKPLKAEMAYIIAERYGVTMDFLYRGRLTELPPRLADSLTKNLIKRTS
jgi:transcriptional regulator with XRE-family HTH domain